MEGISRTVTTRGAGWVVRMKLAGQPPQSKFFNDRQYGGKKLALAAAQRHWRQWAAAHPERGHLPFYTRPMKHNQTGVNGVSETYNRSRITGEKLPCFNVTYKLAGQRQQKRFYVHHYASRDEALAEAAAFRRAMEKEMLKEWKQAKRAQARARK
jgi:hypothetical protein